MRGLNVFRFLRSNVVPSRGTQPTGVISASDSGTEAECFKNVFSIAKRSYFRLRAGGLWRRVMGDGFALEIKGMFVIFFDEVKVFLSKVAHRQTRWFTRDLHDKEHAGTASR